MKKLILLLSLLALPAKAQTTNVLLYWNDTNNFKAAVLGSNGVVVIPAVTSMIYRVWFSTNLLTPPNTWTNLKNILVTGNPGTNAMSTSVPAGDNFAFFTLTASDPYVALNSDFSGVVGVRPRPSPVKAGIAPASPLPPVDEP